MFQKRSPLDRSLHSKSPSKSKRVEKSMPRISKKERKEVFSDASGEDQVVDESEKIHFIKSSSHLSFSEHFLQKFYDSDLWKVLIGSFCCALFVAYNWHIIAIISFVALLSSYSQWKNSERSAAIEYTSKMLSKDPERLKQFLLLKSAPKNMSKGKPGDAPCEWINDILAKFWPNINQIAQNQIDKKGFTKKGLDVGNGLKIYFERFTLGDKPPALTSIHVRQNGHRKDEITLILKLIYFGNCLVLFSYKTKVFLKAKAGVKDVYFRGNAVLVLRPLLEVPPFIGGLSVCLDEVPFIDYNGINLANIADNKLFKNFIINILKNYLVAPNKIFVPLLNNANVKRELKFPFPIGLALVEIIEAEDLPVMDSNRCLIFPGSSDPFCKVKIGETEFTTATVSKNLNPFFGETFSAPIHDFNDFIKIDVFDKDSLSADDIMGSIELKLLDIGRNNNLNGKDKWLPIGQSPTGSLHFRTAIFELSSNKRNIQKIESAIRESSVRFPVGVVSVYIYYVTKISTTDEEVKQDFKPMVRLRFSDQTFQTKTSKPPKNGFYYFEESSHFLVNDFRNEFLEVRVVCQEMKRLGLPVVYGESNIEIRDIIKSKQDMALNQDFAMKKTVKQKDKSEAKNTGVVRMFISLRVCKFGRQLVDNLKVPSNVLANAEESRPNSSLKRFYRELNFIKKQ